MRCLICGATAHTTDMHYKSTAVPAFSTECKLTPAEEAKMLAEANAFERIRIVTLCGSTRFKDLFDLANMHFTLLGFGVLSCGLFGHTDQPQGAKFLVDRPNAKEMLDRLHFMKIDAAEFIYVINPGGYVGDSTKREIEYAKANNKQVMYMFPEELSNVP